MKKYLKSIAAIASYFEFFGNQEIFIELIETYPLIFRQIIFEIENKKFHKRTIELPQDKGKLYFFESSPKISVRYKKGDKEMQEKNFTNIMSDYIKDVQNECKTKEHHKSLLQKAINRNALETIDNLLSDY